MKITDSQPRYLVVRGLAGNDTIDATATAFGVTAFGDQGTDTILGGSGPDILMGDAQADTLIGNGGMDVLLGDSGRVERGSSYQLLNIATDIPALSWHLRGQRPYAAFEVATTFDQTGGNDIIRGGAGNDVLFGGAANDVLDGDGGEDVLVGDGGAAKIVAGRVVRVTAANRADDGNDTIDASGSADSDIVLGGSGNDTIHGGATDRASNILLGDNGVVLLDDPAAVASGETSTSTPRRRNSAAWTWSPAVWEWTTFSAAPAAIR